MKLRDLLKVTSINNGNNVYVHYKRKRISEHVFVQWECDRCNELMQKCECLLDDEIERFNINQSAINIYLK